ncbi:MAG: universal stress protein, partial [Desulfobacterales bacterium]
KNGRLHLLEGDNPAELIIKVAGDSAIIVMGASLRHDVYRRMLGSLPMQVLSQTESSVLLVKLPPEADSDFFKDPFTC